ncbi:gluconokinase [Ramlibacter sp. CrO1]|uniref:Gluconokinase n=2 Tax=Ramlibacter algicola TaxID=2795217 RepID=A0A934Q3X2_9BURK|nr:gluconokinase [Ramlibacter algicola]
MGVAGCGKSEVGARLASALGLPLVEGDTFHPATNVEKMRAGIPLDDADRAGWLQSLADELGARRGGAVLTCSALKRSYRDILRTGSPSLAFVHLRLSPEQARERVASRPGHFYPPTLVDSQFAALEDPAGEPRVVTVNAALPLDAVVQACLAGLRSS